MKLNLGSGTSGAIRGAGTGASIGSVVPGLGTATGAVVGGTLGLLGGLFGGGGGMSRKDQEKLMDRAWEYEKEGMGLQYGYNQKAADAEYQRNLDMWNATNVEAQRQHLENAGLSVGLMYGNGGVMQASTAGGSQQGVQGPKMNPVEAALQMQALGLQMKSIESQNMLNVANAAKAGAEAQKISGADTKLANATVDNLIAQTTNENEKYKLIRAQTRFENVQSDLGEMTINLQGEQINVAKHECIKLARESEKLLSEIQNTKIDVELKKATAQDVVNQMAATTAQMIKNLTKTSAETSQIYATINKIQQDILLGKEANDIKWNELQNDLIKYSGEMGIKDEQVKQEYMSIVVEALKGLIQTAAGYKLLSGGQLPIIKGFKK